MASAQKKGRALNVTRPKPTIYGNCDSWNFIVGKKPRTYRRQGSGQGPLQGRNEESIHSLFTNCQRACWDNMWAICGCTLERRNPSRIVVLRLPDMRRMERLLGGFYRKMSLARFEVSGCKQIWNGWAAEKNVRPCLFLITGTAGKPQTRVRAGAFGGPARLSGPDGSAGRWPVRPGAAAPEWACSCPPWPPPRRTRARCRSRCCRSPR